MTREEVAQKVKEIIGKTTSMDPADIADDAHFVDDLELDSLAQLEIGIDVDFAFKLGLKEEQMETIRTVTETVDLVLSTLASKESVASA